MPACFIGSHAFCVATSNNSRKINDFDLIADFKSAQEILRVRECTTIYPINKGKTLFGRTKRGMIYEVEIAWPGSTGEALLKYLGAGEDRIIYAPLNVLYTLKMSHRYLRNSPHFLKTMRDIQEMRALGAEIPEDLQDWYKRRMKETYDYSHPNLNQDSKGFFSGDGVDYRYDHDSIHEAISYPFQPVYKSYLKDGAQVGVDKSKWDALEDGEKRIAVYEEACVLALERSLIPYPGKKSPEQAFEMALIKVASSITSGWFREYAWENFDKVLALYHKMAPYHLKFASALEDGRIRDYVSN